MVKRIQSACLLQTIRFPLKEDIGHEAAVLAVKEEVAHYKAQLIQRHIKHQILDETEQPDGSIILHIKKQYNQYSTDEYFH